VASLLMLLLRLTVRFAALPVALMTAAPGSALPLLRSRASGLDYGRRWLDRSCIGSRPAFEQSENLADDRCAFVCRPGSGSWRR